MPEATARRAALTMAIEVLPLSCAYLNRRLLICVQCFSALPVHTQKLVQHLRADGRTPAAGAALRAQSSTA